MFLYFMLTASEGEKKGNDFKGIIFKDLRKLIGSTIK